MRNGLSAFSSVRICGVIFIAILSLPISWSTWAQGGDVSFSSPAPAECAGGFSFDTGQKQAQVVAGKPITMEVALVTVPVVVTGQQGRLVPDLKRSDFRIYENGVAQTVDRLVPESDPFNIVLMMDTSGSTHFKLGEMQKAALAFVDSLRSQDHLLVTYFDDAIHVDGNFSQDRTRLRQALQQIPDEGGQTRLYDALEIVMREHLGRIQGRKAIVLFTDGVDNESLHTGSAETLAMIEQSDVIVYAIQYDTRKDVTPDRFHVPTPAGYASFNAMYSRAIKYLGNLASHSGGRLYHAETLPSLQSAFTQIAEELSRQYTLCYYPTNQKRDGTFRRIRVNVAQPGVEIRARTGYRAGR